MSNLLLSRRNTTWIPVLVALFLCSLTAFGQLTASSNTVNFGTVQVGSMNSVPIPVSNGSKSNLTISQANVTGTGFSFTGPNLPITLAPQQSANLYVTFYPQAPGAVNGTLTVAMSNFVGRWAKQHGSTMNLSLSGIGSAGSYLTPSPSAVSFGNIPVGTAKVQSVTVNNSGVSNITVSQAAVSGTGFSLNSFTGPVTLGAGQSLILTVAFSPASSGTASGTLAIASNASNPNLPITLSGAGASAGYLTPSASALSFGSVPTGTTQQQSVTVNNSGGSSVTVSQAAVSGAGFAVSGLSSPVTLAAGQSLSLTVAFTPTAAGTSSGTLAVASNASDSSLPIALSGAGASAGYLTPSPSVISFGSVPTGTTQKQSVTINNSGGSSVTVSQAAATGAGFAVSGLSSPVTLASGQSLSLTVAFTPAAAGTSSGTLVVASNASDSSLPIAISGTGTSATAGQLTASPGSLSFGNVSVGSSSSQNGALSAIGSSVTVSSVSSNNSQFAIGGISLPITIPAGQSVPFNVTFSPLVTGTVSGSISIVSNASTSAIAEAVSGSGQAVQHTVSLSWGPSSSSVSGYNIYRGTVSGGPYAKVNASVDAATTYADSTVQSGQTYYYVTTAVNSSGMESTYSNQVVAQVP